MPVSKYFDIYETVNLRGKSATITVGSILSLNIGEYIPRGPLLTSIINLCSSFSLKKAHLFLLSHDKFLLAHLFQFSSGSLES